MNSTTDTDVLNLGVPTLVRSAGSWTWWILQIGSVFLSLLGVPGNILSFLVMKSSGYRHKSYSHYLSTLAVFDTFVLIDMLIRHVILAVDGDSAALSDIVTNWEENETLLEGIGEDGNTTLPNTEAATLVVGACKMFNFIEHVCYLMSSWLVLCLTVERFVAVMLPLKKNLFCRQRHAVAVILITFAVMAYTQVFRLVVYEYDVSVGCVAAERYQNIYVILHVYVYQLTLQFLLPATFILVLNVIILVRLQRLRTEFPRRQTSTACSSDVDVHDEVEWVTRGGSCRSRRETDIGHGNGNVNVPNTAERSNTGNHRLYTRTRRMMSARTRTVQRGGSTGSGQPGQGGARITQGGAKITVTLLVVSFTYLVTLLPLLLLSLIMHIFIVWEIEGDFQLFVDLSQLFELLSQVNYAINFYIYVLTGEQFRLVLRQMFRKCRKNCKDENLMDECSFDRSNVTGSYRIGSCRGQRIIQSGDTVPMKTLSSTTNTTSIPGDQIVVDVVYGICEGAANGNKPFE